ncbi:MAG: hypothetical protein A2X61_15030 [Ignavibacteria bacterium GWB2_35_12]|nr:MAG: hypothetical protein A2X63_12260 [Ignavibacteria bacterium GWA2_35_8]OGU41779.1 MAG: hypothetical protein A2X61_15030 [Ignavibacteria bacterium GWB2_35_12]OGV24362.1 MAG: hypothetical protein A2475_05325 [Ignavibacteria bacterium RIFOXYC2_FULL_35_21]
MENNFINNFTSIGSSIIVSVTGLFEATEIDEYNENKIIGYNDKPGFFVITNNGHTHTENNNTDPLTEIANALTSPMFFSGYNPNYYWKDNYRLEE